MVVRIIPVLSVRWRLRRPNYEVPRLAAVGGMAVAACVSKREQC